MDVEPGSMSRMPPSAASEAPPTAVKSATEDNAIGYDDDQKITRFDPDGHRGVAHHNGGVYRHYLVASSILRHIDNMIRPAPWFQWYTRQT